MRLIDADALISKIWEQHKVTEESYDLCVDELKEVYCGIVSLIDEQPTAYDVNEVIQQIERVRDNGYVSGVTNNLYELGAVGALNKAIEIVKAGGKHDK